MDWKRKLDERLLAIRREQERKAQLETKQKRDYEKEQEKLRRKRNTEYLGNKFMCYI